MGSVEVRSIAGALLAGLPIKPQRLLELVALGRLVSWWFWFLAPDALLDHAHAVKLTLLQVLFCCALDFFATLALS